MHIKAINAMKEYLYYLGCVCIAILGGGLSVITLIVIAILVARWLF